MMSPTYAMCRPDGVVQSLVTAAEPPVAVGLVAVLPAVAIAADDCLGRRMDFETRTLVDAVPAAPADNSDFTFSWNPGLRAHVPTPTLARLQRDAHAAIDAAAGAARLRYITDVPGQQAVYILKLDEARALLAAAGTPTPLIDSEAAATGATREQVAAEVVAIAGQWNDVLSPAIEGARIGGKRDVSAAQTPEAVAQARSQALAALAAI